MRLEPGVVRLSKAEWEAKGGLRNSALFRQADEGGAWEYYEDTKHDRL